MVTDADSRRRKATGEVSHASGTKVAQHPSDRMRNVMRLLLPYLLTYQVLKNISTSVNVDSGCMR